MNSCVPLILHVVPILKLPLFQLCLEKLNNATFEDLFDACDLDSTVDRSALCRYVDELLMLCYPVGTDWDIPEECSKSCLYDIIMKLWKSRKKKNIKKFSIPVSSAMSSDSSVELKVKPPVQAEVICVVAVDGYPCVAVHRG